VSDPKQSQFLQPGWYPLNDGSGLYRYYLGQWTDQVAPMDYVIYTELRAMREQMAKADKRNGNAWLVRGCILISLGITNLLLWGILGTLSSPAGF
jgi:hypothetical protein